MARWGDTAAENKEMNTVYIDSKTKNLPVYYTHKGVEHFVGNTPCSLYSDKASVKYVTVKNGDIYQTIELEREDRLSTYWNFIPACTFLWGYVVDKGTSRSRIYKNKNYFVDL